MSRPSNNTRRRWANLVMPYLPTAPDAPISVPELVQKTQLRSQEVHHGVGMIRDEMASDGGRPLLSSGAGYRFSFDEAEVADFRSRQTRRAYTTIRRLYSGVIRPYLAAQPPGSQEGKQAAKQMSRALEDLHELISVNGRT